MSHDQYAESRLEAEDRSRAIERFRVVHDRRRTSHYDDEHGRWLQSVHVVAEAGTGSRYSVVVTPLDKDSRDREGGPVVVTVLSPWTDAKVMQADGVVAASYVAEHLTAGRWRDDRLHAGDLAALTLTVAHALGRDAHPMVDG